MYIYIYIYIHMYVRAYACNVHIYMTCLFGQARRHAL